MSAITVISSMATRHILNDLAAAYRAAHGESVAVQSIGGVDAARKVASGEAADIVCLAANVLGKLEAEGRIVPGSIAPVAISEIAVAVPAGAAEPDLSSAATVKAAMLAARSVGYSTGPSGDHILKLVETWGIADAMQGKLKLAPPGVPVASLVAQGEADLGLQQLSELMGQAGIAIAGPLPADCQLATTFSVGIATASLQPEAARRVIAAWTGAEAAATVEKYGMQAP